MAGTELEDLNARFALRGELRFDIHEEGVLLAEISNRHAMARIALHGAQVLAYQPHGAAPVIWLSSEARCVPGKTIRGGIPVCWPWFGPHPEDATKPAHGYARTALWQILRTSATDTATQLILELPMRSEYAALTPHAASLEATLCISVGATLRVSLTTRNTGTIGIPLSQALHSYFNVSDIGAAQISGLEGCDYIDKVDGDLRRAQHGAIHIDSETDRIYLETDKDSVIDDSGLRRRIRIKSEGSRSTVVWNPWVAKAQKLGDVGADGYRHMLCVETTNAADDARQLAPGAEHTLTTEISTDQIKQ